VFENNQIYAVFGSSFGSFWIISFTRQSKKNENSSGRGEMEVLRDDPEDDNLTVDFDLNVNNFKTQFKVT
jgi:hypothetical protein